MKITLYEFSRLPEQEQYDITFNKGTFIEYFLNGDQRFALYAVDMFFVEVEYDNDSNKILGHSFFKNSVKLDKYIPF